MTISYFHFYRMATKVGPLLCNRRILVTQPKHIPHHLLWPPEQPEALTCHCSGKLATAQERSSDVTL